MKLTESQMVEQISEIFKEKSIEQGLNYILKLSAEALMKAERSAYLARRGWSQWV